jgi:hypothetical protein
MVWKLLLDYDGILFCDSVLRYLQDCIPQSHRSLSAGSVPGICLYTVINMESRAVQLAEPPAVQVVELMQWRNHC